MTQKYNAPFKESYGRLSQLWYVKDRSLSYLASCKDEATAQLIVAALNAHIIAKDNSPAAEPPTKEIGER